MPTSPNSASCRITCAPVTEQAVCGGWGQAIYRHSFIFVQASRPPVLGPWHSRQSEIPRREEAFPLLAHPGRFWGHSWCGAVRALPSLHARQGTSRELELWA
jgi:hypothetical protein